MARPKKRIAVGDNGPDEDARRSAIRMMIKSNEALQEVRARHNALRKTLRGDGHTLGHIDRTIKRLSMTKAEVRADQIDEAKYLQSVNLPAGDALDLFEPEEDEGESLYQARVWRERGKSDGLAGFGWADSPPEGCPSENRTDYALGHEEADKQVQADWLARQNAMPPVQSAANDAEPEDEEFEEIGEDEDGFAVVKE